MSYSIRANAATLHAAMAMLTTNFDEQVVAHQPEHKADRDLLLKTAEGVGAVIKIDETKDVHIVASGGLGWNGRDDATGEPNITQANVSVQIFQMDRPPA